MDIVGPLSRAPGNRLYMLAMADYFSKWIEAEAFAEFVLDNSERFCVRWNNISLKKSSPRNPQSNGQAESSNKIIVENLRKRLEELGGKWADELPLVLWSNRTTPKTSTCQTPFSLTFGAEAVIPSEVLVPTHRYGCMMKELNQTEMIRSLDTIDELRTSARIRLASYKQSVAGSYNKNVKIRFSVRCSKTQRTTKLVNLPTNGKVHTRWNELLAMVRID
ncbi:uncharacterized protein LOC141649173 [Silene latifolia]|uniref:uncharacterized protein LOC141649173 n=1 Tax=Silene latifolia TaxID=37657 RepID=UPI003D771E5B